VACNLLPHGYWFYVTGRVPDEKAPHRIDEKLLRKYGAGLSPAARARRKRQGLANVRYVRHGRFFALLATRGEHPFFEQEAASIRDIRRVPLKFAGYWISYRRGQRTREGARDAAWHAHVQIEPRRFQELRAYFAEMATRCSSRMRRSGGRCCGFYARSTTDANGRRCRRCPPKCCRFDAVSCGRFRRVRWRLECWHHAAKAPFSLACRGRPLCRWRLHDRKGTSYSACRFRTRHTSCRRGMKLV